MINPTEVFLEYRRYRAIHSWKSPLTYVAFYRWFTGVEL